MSIEIKNLVKKFSGKKVVDNISLEIKQGEIFGILGPNGAGKTTTLSVLTTLLKPSKGTAIINGFDVRKNKNKVRKSIGMVFQDPTLDGELTAEENLDFHGRLYKMPSKLRKKKVPELLKLVELYNRKSELVKRFSGGMKRRLEIARGILHDPKVLFLDEPTLGLDPQTRNKIWEYIKKLSSEKSLTTIITTHYMDEADKLCDRIAIMDEGKIIALDTPEKLKSGLGETIITIKTNQKSKLLKVLKKEKYNLKDHDSEVKINSEHSNKDLPNLVRILDKNSVDIESISVNKPTLEDVFLHYTGKTLREKDEKHEGEK